MKDRLLDTAVMGTIVLATRALDVFGWVYDKTEAVFRKAS